MQERVENLERAASRILLSASKVHHGERTNTLGGFMTLDIRLNRDIHRWLGTGAEADSSVEMTRRCILHSRLSFGRRFRLYPEGSETGNRWSSKPEKLHERHTGLAAHSFRYFRRKIFMDGAVDAHSWAADGCLISTAQSFGCT